MVARSHFQIKRIEFGAGFFLYEILKIFFPEFIKLFIVVYY